MQKPPAASSKGTVRNASAKEKNKEEKREDSVGVASTGPEIIDPDNPEIPSSSVEDPPPQESRWRRGFRRVLTSVAGVCKRLSKLILKVVKTIFPWNRRAKRRLAAGDGAADDDEEL